MNANDHGALSKLRIHHGREIVALATPIVMTTLSMTLMWTVDTIFLGHYSSLALGAAGLGGMLTWAAYSLVNNLSRISNTFVAQAHGKGDDEAVGHYTWQTIYLSLATGTLMMFAGYYSDHFLPLIKNPPDVTDATYTYIRWRTLSAVFTQLLFALTGYFQGRRDVRTPMWAGIVANLLNVLLDVWLIFGWSGVTVGGLTLLAAPTMGVKGAAIATSIGTTVNALILVVAAVLPRANRLRYRIHVPRRLDPRAVGEIVRVGQPSALEGFVDMSSFAVFTSLIGRAGAVSLAASQITIQLLSFSFMPMWGLTTAGSVLTGNEMGAGRPDRAASYGRQVYKLGVYYCLVLLATYLVLRGTLFRIFTDDPAVLAFGGTLAVIAAGFQFADGLRMVGSGILTGAGDTRPVMLVTMFIMWGLFLPMTWVLIVQRGGDVTTAWLGGAVCYGMQAVALWGRFRSGRWQKVEIFRGGGRRQA